MMKKIMSLLLVLALSLTVISASAAEFEIPASLTPGVSTYDVGDNQYEENEPNNDFNEADLLGNDYTVFGTADSGENVDVYAFTLTRRSDVAIVTVAEKAGFVFLLCDANGEALAVSYDEGYQEGLYGDSMGYVMEPGDYYLILGDENGNGGYMYMLYTLWQDHVHQWDAGVVTTQPTYTTTGVKTYTCTGCLDTYTETVPVVPHEHSYSATVIAPDCVYAGYTLHTCTLCGGSYTDSVVANLGHDWSEGVCLTCGTAWEDQFVDVPKEEYYYEPVMWAVENAITAGSGLINTFEPEADCTRAQVVTFLHRAAGTPEPALAENPFTDVKEDDWYYKAVLWAVEKGITVGTSETTFSPDDTCTRAQVATFLYRSAGEPGHSVEENPFVDLAEDWYVDPVLWAYENDITQGDGAADTFNPEGTCIRAQIVTFLYRAAQVETPEEEPEEPSRIGAYADTSGEYPILVEFFSDGTCYGTDINGECTTTYTVDEDGNYVLTMYEGEEYAYEMVISPEDLLDPDQPMA